MRYNVLLMLNDKKEFEVLSKNLQCNYHVYAASGTNELLQLVDSVSIQLIICSVDQPARNGWALCSLLKSSFQYAHIPIILLTAEGSLVSKIKSLEAGADACLRKPYSRTYLEAQIKNLITNRLKITEHYAFSQAAVTETPGVGVNEDFIKKLNDCIIENVHNSALDVNLLARCLNMSRPTLYRKIKTITRQTPNELINLTRLSRAAGLLECTAYRVNEIAGMVGFSSQSSFGKAFIKQFGLTPTEYQRRNKKTGTQRRNALYAPGWNNLQ